jgi:ABC-type antimicrobial peptide transport system permease subunit
MYAVSQRTREFALRMALGARPADLMRGVLRQGVVITMTGVALGLAIAAFLARLLRTFLFGVSPFDPVTFAGWSAVLIVVTLVAAYLPARRALTIDPAAALAGRV